MEKKTVLCLIAVVAIIVVVIFAGCIEKEGPAPTLTPPPTITAPKEMAGTFVLQVTDQPSAIDDFDILNVTVSEVMLHKTGEADSGTNETWITLEPSNHSFDLTTLQEGNVTTIVNESVETGKYTQVRLIVESAKGIANESMVNVTVPSGMLKVVKPFTITENQTVTFRFDINVVKAGEEYNVVPVIGKSGVLL